MNVSQKLLLGALFMQCICLVLVCAPGVGLSAAILSFMSELAGAHLSNSVALATTQNIFVSVSSGLVLFLLTTVSILLYQRKLISTLLLQLLLALLTLSPLFFNGVEALKRSCDFGFYDHKPSIISILEKCAPGRLKEARFDQYGGESYQIIDKSYLERSDAPSTVGGLRFLQDRLFPNSNMPLGISYASGFELAEIGVFTSIYSGAIVVCPEFDLINTEKMNITKSSLPYARFCALTATEFVITGTHRNEKTVQNLLEPDLFQLLFQDNLTDSRVYKLLLPTQRFYFAQRLSVVSSSTEVGSKIFNTSDSHSLDLNAAYVESDGLKLISPFLNKPAAAPASGAVISTQIKLLSERPERVELHISKREPGLLVMRDQFYPGWKAEVDGKAVPLIRANLFNRAVPVPAGEHSLVFSYVPESLYTAFKLATVALFLLIIFGGVLWRLDARRGGS